jgi:cystathionine beta-lyase/cystathionine gamma-synthase
MERHSKNGMAVAAWAERHPAIVKVSYPGLPSHPDHELAEKLLDGYGGMMGLEIKGGVKATEKFLKKLRVVTHAPSLAGVESLISEPRLTSHTHLTPEERAKHGIPDGFVRLSCGIEDAEDIIADLEQALS